MCYDILNKEIFKANSPTKIRYIRLRHQAYRQVSRERNSLTENMHGIEDVASGWRQAWFCSPRLPWWSPKVQDSSELRQELMFSNIQAQLMVSLDDLPTFRDIDKCTPPSHFHAYGILCYPFFLIHFSSANKLIFYSVIRTALENVLFTRVDDDEMLNMRKTW